MLGFNIFCRNDEFCIESEHSLKDVIEMYSIGSEIQKFRNANPGEPDPVLELETR